MIAILLVLVHSAIFIQCQRCDLDYTTTPCENACVDNEGNIITRTCGGDYQTASVWSEPYATCSANSVHLAAMHFLSERNAFLTKNLLINVSTITHNTSSLITRILSNAAKQDDTEYFQSSFFVTTDRLLNINEPVFSEAFCTIANILNSMEKYINETAMATIYLSYTNLAVNIKILESSDQMSTVEHISAKFPKNMIEGSSGGFNVPIVVFKSRKLFYQGALDSHVANSVIPSANKYLHEPIGIYFEHNSEYDIVVCVYWDYEKTHGNWSKVAVKTITQNDSSSIEYKAYHLTTSVLFEVSEAVIKDLSPPIDNYLCGVGCFVLYLISTIIVLAVIANDNWYQPRINTLQIWCFLLFEVLMIFVAVITKHAQTSHVRVEQLMDYLVLGEFVLVLVITKFHDTHFVTVMQSRNTPQHTVTYTVIGLLGSLLSLIITASALPYQYNSGILNFSYPKNKIFIYSVVIPISIDLIHKMAAFISFCFNTSKRITRNAKEKNLQIMFALLLWFVLGLAWLWELAVPKLSNYMKVAKTCLCLWILYIWANAMFCCILVC